MKTTEGCIIDTEGDYRLTIREIAKQLNVKLAEPLTKIELERIGELSEKLKNAPAGTTIIWDTVSKDSK